MNVPAIVFIILTLLFVIYYFCPMKTLEGFYANPYRYNRYGRRPYWWSRYFHPYWNTYLGYVSPGLASYDLRGDVPIPYSSWIPFNMSSHVPLYDRPVYVA